MAKSGIMHIIEKRRQCIIVKHKLSIVAGDFMSLRTGLEMLSDGILQDVPLAHISMMYWWCDSSLSMQLK